MKWLLRILILFLISLLAIGFATLSPVITDSYSNTPEKQATLANIKARANTEVPTGKLKAGWSKVNLSPDFTVPMATSKARDGKHFREIEDSIYVRAFVFDNGHRKVAWLTADLLIIPPLVTEQLRQRLPEIGFTEELVFMGATHVHSSIGGWQPGYVGSLFAGEYDARIVDHITDKILNAIQLAEKDLQPAAIGYRQDTMPNQIKNRLVGKQGEVDPFKRIVRVKKADGTQAAILTYAAHATCLADTFMNLHRGYPGYLVDYLENKPRIDFAAFAAGAVGSMGPAFSELGPWGQAQQLAADLQHSTLGGFHHIPVDSIVGINSQQVPIQVHEPNFKVNDKLRIRPWVFNKLMDQHPLYLDYLQIGDIVFVGVPADFSGELVRPLMLKARAHGKQLIITSFNGGFCGYITHDKWQDTVSYEIRTMNWYGPNSGSYFSDLIAEMVERY